MEVAQQVAAGAGVMAVDRRLFTTQMFMQAGNCRRADGIGIAQQTEFDDASRFESFAGVIGRGSMTNQPRRATTVTMPRVTSRVSASRIRVRLTPNSSHSCCSPRRVPGASCRARIASVIRLAMCIDDLMEWSAFMQSIQQYVCQTCIQA